MPCSAGKALQGQRGQACQACPGGWVADVQALAEGGQGPLGEGELALIRPLLSCAEAIAEDPSTCEICAYAACTGC